MDEKGDRKSPLYPMDAPGGAMYNENRMKKRFSGGASREKRGKRRERRARSGHRRRWPYEIRKKRSRTFSTFWGKRPCCAWTTRAFPPGPPAKIDQVFVALHGRGHGQPRQRQCQRVGGQPQPVPGHGRVRGKRPGQRRQRREAGLYGHCQRHVRLRAGGGAAKK